MAGPAGGNWEGDIRLDFRGRLRDRKNTDSTSSAIPYNKGRYNKGRSRRDEQILHPTKVLEKSAVAGGYEASRSSNPTIPIPATAILSRPSCFTWYIISSARFTMDSGVRASIG